jgi:hypothetical protein
MAPPVFSGPPTLDDVIYAVNANTSRVQSVQTDSASLSTHGLLSVRANLAMQVPRRFRLRVSMLGPELDVGSNDELFWMWAKSSPEPAVFYATHAQFQASRAGQIFPVDPAWLLETFGLVHLDPMQAHQGPTLRAEGLIELRSPYGPAGQLTRTLTIDGRYGWILGNRVENASGQVLAASAASQYRFYQDAGVSLPHRIQIDLPLVQKSFTISSAQYSINQLVGDAGQLWAMPQMEGYPAVNVAESQPAAPDWQQGPSVVPAAPPYPVHTGFHPKYRGYSSMR